MLFKYHLIWILNSKFETNMATLIVPIIARYLLSDYMGDEAARKFLHQSESNQQQHTASLTADESSNSEEQSSKKTKTNPLNHPLTPFFDSAIVR